MELTLEEADEVHVHSNRDTRDSSSLSADDREGTMVCPACLSAIIVSQLPAISAAALSAAGVKMAYDQKRSPKTREVRAVQPLRIHKVKFQGNLQHFQNLDTFHCVQGSTYFLADLVHGSLRHLGACAGGPRSEDDCATARLSSHTFNSTKVASKRV